MSESLYCHWSGPEYIPVKCGGSLCSEALDHSHTGRVKHSTTWETMPHTTNWRLWHSENNIKNYKFNHWQQYNTRKWPLVTRQLTCMLSTALLDALFHVSLNFREDSSLSCASLSSSVSCVSQQLIKLQIMPKVYTHHCGMFLHTYSPYLLYIQQFVCLFLK